jgi:parallel beta-helix repeat protein
MPITIRQKRRNGTWLVVDGAQGFGTAGIPGRSVTVFNQAGEPEAQIGDIWIAPEVLYGPRVTARPSGSVVVLPGQSIAAATGSYPPGTTFWLAAGHHPILGEIIPKSGNTYVGELGAILDGTGWATSDIDAGAFHALNQDIDDVTLRNLVIRNMPSYGVQAYRDYSDRWTVDACEIYNCRTGVGLPSGSTVSNSRLHHCVGNSGALNPAERGGAYAFNQADNVTFRNNEVSYNGIEQKFLMILGLLCRDNWFHHNLGDGFWIDGEGQGSIIENNLSEQNGRTGMTLEMGVDITLRNNISRNNATSGALLTMSRNCRVYGNTLEYNPFNLDLFLNCDTLSEGYPWNPDLANNAIYSNVVRAAIGQYATIMSGGAACAAPYVSNTKNNTFSGNTYVVPDTGNYWVWGGPRISWASWQGIPQDIDGTRVIG